MTACKKIVHVQWLPLMSGAMKVSLDELDRAADSRPGGDASAEALQSALSQTDGAIFPHDRTSDRLTVGGAVLDALSADRKVRSLDDHLEQDLRLEGMPVEIVGPLSDLAAPSMGPIPPTHANGFHAYRTGHVAQALVNVALYQGSVSPRTFPESPI